MSQAWKWGFGLGILVAFVGLIVIASAWSGNGAENILAAGLTVFSAGILILSVSFYFQAKSVQTQAGGGSSVARPSGGKQRKLCDICKKSVPVIQCTMHKTSLCPTCLAGHYDSRGCVYVPTVRKTGARQTRGTAASLG